MLLNVDPTDSRPLFRQISDEVQRCVAVGVMKPGEPLPAVRALAAELKVNPNTVQHAYRSMEQEGIVYVKRGIGTFIAAAAVPAKTSASRQSVAARQIAERALREAYRHGLLGSDLIAALQEISARRR
jgi:GntR family transcriptional regulator